MLWKELKTIFLFWLLACLLSLFFINLLRAESINPNTVNIKQTPIQLLNNLDHIISKQAIELENSKKQLRLWQGQFTTLEAQHKILVDQSIQQQDTIQTQELSLQNLKNSMQSMDNAHNEEVSHYKWKNIEYAIGGFAIGFSVGLVITALVLK